MSKSNNKYLPILAILAIILGIGALLYVLIPSGKSSEDNNKSGGGYLSVTTKTPTDLGAIPIGNGKVSANFSFKNTGNSSLKIIDGQTSCMCTVAVIQVDGQSPSPTITMPMGQGIRPTQLGIILEPGEVAELVAVFDPMAHGPDAIGPIKRDVILTTDSKETPGATFSLIGNVIR